LNYDGGFGHTLAEKCSTVLPVYYLERAGRSGVDQNEILGGHTDCNKSGFFKARHTAMIEATFQVRRKNQEKDLDPHIKSPHTNPEFAMFN